MTCEWCVYKRLFIKEDTIIEEEPDADEFYAMIDAPTYYLCETAEILSGLFKDVKQIWAFD